jgi:hypothetical protein
VSVARLLNNINNKVRAETYQALNYVTSCKRVDDVVEGGTASSLTAHEVMPSDFSTARMEFGQDALVADCVSVRCASCVQWHTPTAPSVEFLMAPHPHLNPPLQTQDSNDGGRPGWSPCWCQVTQGKQGTMT